MGRAAQMMKRWFVRRKHVSAIRTRYGGILFRSTLEADWAYTFDQLGITWSYEPIALRLSNGVAYRPDFHLPHQRVWCEVKGPENVRIEKPHRLARDLISDPFDQDEPMVVILRPPIRDRAVVEGAWPSENIGLSMCDLCLNWTFVDYDGTWSCRTCNQDRNLFGNVHEQAKFWRIDRYADGPDTPLT